MASTSVAAATGRSTTTAAPTESLKHIRALDGVRGLAILLVFLFHLLSSNHAPSGSPLIGVILKLRDTGWIGVDLFFALSGFLITGILFDTLASQHYFRNFYIRRALRIFPLYYGVLLVLFLLVRPDWRQGRQFYLLPVYLQNTSLWWNAPDSGIIKSLTGHLWSLAVEEQFYLVWPLVVFCIRDRRKLLWIALAVVLIAPVLRTLLLTHGGSIQATYKTTLCRADSLLAGAALALAIRGPRRAAILRAAAPLFWLAILACALLAWKTGSFFWGDNFAVNTIGYSLLAVAGTSLIALCLRAGSTAKLMSISPLRWLGKYSYGIYVIHQMTFMAYQSFLLTHIHSRVLLHLALPLSNLAVTLPLAWLSYRFYEQPFLRLKRYFPDRPAPTQ
ncbi:acyltransferase family protein [Edaphobacter aggregans]|uniref:acyltransferase family protein n=1 Tax=Edaphobacter aggregans TaxID=570835 RepID=UPI00069103DF|nr:acyltransferase [Edaphobacter aggregans]